MTERERWLEKRRNGLGASDAAAVLGISPYKSNVQLYDEKTGKREPDDISNKDCVVFGKEAEKHIRSLFALEHPEYRVEYDEFKMWSRPERPWLFATLDGSLIDTEGRTGILEIKTTELQSYREWEKWTNKIPDYYYAQIVHQLAATGADFSILKAYIRYTDREGSMAAAVREYFFFRDKIREDVNYLIEKETAFWKSVTERRAPALILPAI